MSRQRWLTSAALANESKENKLTCPWNGTSLLDVKALGKSTVHDEHRNALIGGTAGRWLQHRQPSEAWQLDTLLHSHAFRYALSDRVPDSFDDLLRDSTSRRCSLPHRPPHSNQSGDREKERQRERDREKERDRETERGGVRTIDALPWFAPYRELSGCSYAARRTPCVSAAIAEPTHFAQSANFVVTVQCSFSGSELPPVRLTRRRHAVSRNWNLDHSVGILHRPAPAGRTLIFSAAVPSECSATPPVPAVR